MYVESYPVSHVSARAMFDDCLTWLRNGPTATLVDTSN